MSEQGGEKLLLVIGSAHLAPELSPWLSTAGWRLATWAGNDDVPRPTLRPSVLLLELGPTAEETQPVLDTLGRSFPGVPLVLAAPPAAQSTWEIGLLSVPHIGVVSTPVHPLQLRPLLQPVREDNDARRLGECVAASELALALVDPETHGLVYANAAYHRMAGRSAESVDSPRSCHRFLFDRDTPCSSCPLAQGPRTTPQAPSQLVHRGRRYAVSAQRLSERGLALCLCQDGTEEHRLARRRIEAEKVAAVGLLAGGVAHQVNNPLGAILAFAELMMRDPSRTPEDMEALELIEQSALRCKRTVESLLTLSGRKVPDTTEPLDLAVCLREAAVLFRARLRTLPLVKFEVHIPPQLPGTSGDSARLCQALLHLMQNGLQALPEGTGVLSLEASVDEALIRVRVRDTGVGIPADLLPRIFDPWFTTRPLGEGTGLGLAITYRIIQEHHGTLDVESEPGRGTTFTLSLPIHIRPPETRA